MWYCMQCRNHVVFDHYFAHVSVFTEVGCSFFNNDLKIIDLLFLFYKGWLVVL